MASLIQKTKEMFTGKPKKGKPLDPSFSSLSHDEKLAALYQEYRCEDRNGRLMLNQTWFRTALYYAGKQSVEWDSISRSLTWYDPLPGEDWYTENQFRKDVNANMAMMARSELKPSLAPASDNPDDVAAARTGESALDVINDDIEYDRQVQLKNLNLCLFGNAFRYETFAWDNAQKTIVPKYKYESIDLPGAAMCACGNTAEATGEEMQMCGQCGDVMEQTPPETIESKVADGYETVPAGRNLEVVTGPLEMYMRAKVQHGLKYQPYLFWVRRLDADIVKDARPEADTAMAASKGPSGSDDLSQYFIDVLSTLTGGADEGVGSSVAQRLYKEVEYAMCWIRPEAFKGDAELKRKYPDGVKFETCNGNYIPDTAINQPMDKCWTHYVYLINPYSAWGDGMVDALPMQDQLNETGSLMVRHMRYSTVGKKLFDSDMIVPEWLSNNPEEAWIPTQRQVDKKLSDAVYEIKPTPLSQDVGQWREQQLQAMQDMTRAYNASVGKSSGANTPYSADVFQAEQAMGQFLPMFKYNRASEIQCTRQKLDLFREHANEERQRKFKDNTGKWSFEKFTGADLGVGSFDIYIPDNESSPKTKAEKAKGLELYSMLAPLMAGLSQKQKVYVLDIIGMPPDANPDTLMSQKAYRDIEAIVKRGENIVVNPFIVDIPVYVKTIKEYLADESGDELAAENPDAFIKLVELMVTAMTMGQQQMASMPPMGPPTDGQPQQSQGTPAKPPQTEMAQAPVPESAKQPMPPLPAGARQG